MKTPTTGLVTFLLLIGLLPSSTAQTSPLKVSQSGPSRFVESASQVIDHGPLTAESPDTPISVTIALGLSNLDEAENLQQSIYTPGNAEYHQFLSADQFVSRFGPSGAEVARIIAELAKRGLAAEKTTATTIKVTGLPADMDRAFAVTLHDYEIPAHDNVPASRFHAPLVSATLPPEIAGSVAAVVGLDSHPALHPMSLASPRSRARPATAATTSTAPAGNPTGLWTVTDFANYYDVEPLYHQGNTGSGHTLGIMTFANFTPSDVFAYWSAVGLKVDRNRIQIANIDGGPGAPSDASDSQETTLDVEQSGGVAPAAKIVVYQAPNTNQGFVDVFAAAVDANVAETLSTSWGLWEWFANLENAPVTDPVTGRTVAMTQTTHELLFRAAIQGQTIFASSGDDGAYDADGYPIAYCYPTLCSLPLTVDYPGSDPDITAAGGTTLPGLQTGYPGAPQFSVNIPNEQVWNWEYLIPYCADIGIPNPIQCQIFPEGSGGGVSVLFPVPSYQVSIPGVQFSQPHQVWRANAAAAAENEVGDYFALPGEYAGRNVPDISMNADPDTGYIIYYTSDVNGFSVLQYWGGTSFVAPQLNAVSALVAESLHVKRLGLLNYPLYGLANTGQAYRGRNPPMHAIPYSDNWFYHGTNGYNPAVGFGTLDVANFAAALRDLY
jgi:subtilase family serine protease